MIPRLAGLKIENRWQKGNPGFVRCTARLTRSLTPREAERMRVLVGLQGRGELLFYDCRPENVEVLEDRLLESLAKVVRPRADGAYARKHSAELAPVRRLRYAR